MSLAGQTSRLLEAVTPEHVVAAIGLVIFGAWLVRTSWGRKALSDSKPRRNDMPVYLPPVLMLVWFGPVQIVILAAQMLVDRCFGVPGWVAAAVANLTYCLCAVTLLIGCLFLARFHFARRLKGLGLNLRSIPEDLLMGLVNLLACWPLVLTMMVATVLVGKLIWGWDYEISKHQELELLAEYSQLLFRVSVVVVAVAVAPVFEEVLFRGLFQTMVRSILIRHNMATSTRPDRSAWLAILAGAALFAMVHADVAHWPALAVLGVCLGYAYEKSGSLFRPIFIHVMFNAVTILAALRA